MENTAMATQPRQDLFSLSAHFEDLFVEALLVPLAGAKTFHQSFCMDDRDSSTEAGEDVSLRLCVRASTVLDLNQSTDKGAKKCIEIDEISVTPLKKGHGTILFRAILRAAMRVGRRVYLAPPNTPDGVAWTSKLIKMGLVQPSTLEHRGGFFSSEMHTKLQCKQGHVKGYCGLFSVCDLIHIKAGSSDFAKEEAELSNKVFDIHCTIVQTVQASCPDTPITSLNSELEAKIPELAKSIWKVNETGSEFIDVICYWYTQVFKDVVQEKPAIQREEFLIDVNRRGLQRFSAYPCSVYYSPMPVLKLGDTMTKHELSQVLEMPFHEIYDFMKNLFVQHASEEVQLMVRAGFNSEPKIICDWSERRTLLIEFRYGYSTPSGSSWQLRTYIMDDESDAVQVATDARNYAKRAHQEYKKMERQKALTIVEHNGRALQHVSEELKADRALVLAAVQQDGLALAHAAEGLKADREVVLAAVQQDGYALEHASPELKDDREVVMAAVQQIGYALGHVSEELQANREVVLAALQQNGYALVYASPGLKGDREVVMAAVQQNGCALEYASEFQNDIKMVLAAVQQNGDALRYASKELKADKEVVLAAVQQDYESPSKRQKAL
jgi:hypothetical protein